MSVFPIIETAMRPLNSETYRTFVDLLNGTFKKPVRERNKTERNAIVSFWRKRSGLTLKRVHDLDVLYFEGKEVLKKDQVHSKVRKALRQTQGGGARGLAHTLRTKYAKVSEASVRQVIESSRHCGHTQASFTNKAPLRNIQSAHVFERVQLDLLQMKQVKYKGTQYRYILTVIDVFSRYLFCRALSNKTAKNVAEALEEIFLEHGWPKIVQSDNGSEFREKVSKLLERHKVKVVKGRPYHPQSQGVVERQNRIIRAKIRFAAHRRGRRGYNWAKELKRICCAINLQPKEVLAYQSPFSVYFGRSKDGSETADTLRKSAKIASERCAKRMRNVYRRKKACSIYRSGDRVLLRYPFGKRVPYKRYILKGKIVKRSRGYDRYLVTFTAPDKSVLSQWVNVEHITSTTLAKERHRRQKAREVFRKLEERQKHKAKYYIVRDVEEVETDLNALNPTNAENEDQELEECSEDSPSRLFCSNEQMEIVCDPDGVGNCQFLSVSHLFSQFGLHRTGTQLREIAVDHLTTHCDHYKNFVEGSFQKYVKGMSKDTTFGDHLTLLALAREFNCQFLIVSSEGPTHTCLVSNTGVYDGELNTLTLGFYPEVHYVAVKLHDMDAFHQIINGLSRGETRHAYTSYKDLRQERLEEEGNGGRMQSTDEVSGYTTSTQDILVLSDYEKSTQIDTSECETSISDNESNDGENDDYENRKSDEIHDDETCAQAGVGDGKVYSQEEYIVGEKKTQNKSCDGEIHTEHGFTEGELNTQDKESDVKARIQHAMSNVEMSTNDCVSDGEMGTQDNTSVSEIDAQDVSEGELLTQEDVGGDRASTQNKNSDDEISIPDANRDDEMRTQDDFNERKRKTQNEEKNAEKITKDTNGNGEMCLQDVVSCGDPNEDEITRAVLVSLKIVILY